MCEYINQWLQDRSQPPIEAKDIRISKGSLVILFPSRILEAVVSVLRKGVELDCGDFKVQTEPLKDSLTITRYEFPFRTMEVSKSTRSGG